MCYLESNVWQEYLSLSLDTHIQKEKASKISKINEVCIILLIENKHTLIHIISNGSQSLLLIQRAARKIL